MTANMSSDAIFVSFVIYIQLLPWICFSLYSLAKREMLLAASESLVGTQQQKLQLSIDGIQKAKARNDQLVKVMINDILCKET